MAPHAFIFIGRSGCGKGTQADLLRKELADKGFGKTLYVETGEVFREFITGKKFSNIRSHEIYETAERQPDFLACYMWTHFLVRDYDKGMNVIFDGTPRSVPEAEIIATAFSFYDFEKVFIIHLNVSRGWSERHLLSRGRSDDATVADINKRLDWFDSDVVPAIDYFKSSRKARILVINGEQAIPAVHKDITTALAL